MPYLNKDKNLQIGNIYHAYNRGYRKQQVFHDTNDYNYFLFLLKKYLDRDMHIRKRVDQNTLISKYPSKLCDEVSLIAFCLMPNHFHLLLKLKTRMGMSKLVSRMSSSYSKYYNDKYGELGSVWQGTYKAVRIKGRKHMRDTITYIHQNPIDLSVNIEKYKYSSIKKYNGRIGGDKMSWVDVAK